MRRRAVPRAAPEVWLVWALIALGTVGPVAATPTRPPVTTSPCTVGSGFSMQAQQPNDTAPSTVSFQITDPRGPPDWVNWSFGDGLTANRTGNYYLSIAHLYQGFGTYQAIVVIGQAGTSVACSAVVGVVPAPFSVAIHATPTEGRAPVTVQFTADLRGGTSTYQSAVWLFGDGQGATGFNVSYTYADPGHYTASLVVVDSAQQEARANTSVRVDPVDGTPLTPAAGPTLPGWAELLLGGGAVFVGVVLVLRWRLAHRPHPAPSPPRLPLEPAVPDPTPVGPGFSPAVEVVALEPSVPTAGPALGPPDPETTAPVALVGPSASAVLPVPEPISPPGPPAPSGAPRLKLSQRVMLHLYKQGHLGDGEVAPIGFTQGGMSEQLGVAQSPLSSVLRRLVVAGLVVQDTRHVRGQPRRLRVYRLSPLGESVARDLYLHPAAESSGASEGVED